MIGVAFPKPDYLKSLERAGGEPLVLKPERDALPDALERCDGVLLTGGADVDPSRYGEADRHSTVEIDAERDEYEIGLTRLALDRDLPLLAICRGVQLLNIVAGGTLVQDIPTSLPESLAHRRPKPARVKKSRAHDVALVPGTRLAGLLEGAAKRNGQVAVNSRHHQSVKTVAPGIRRVRDGAGRDRRGHRTCRPRLLRRRAVASGELLANRRVLGALRRTD